MIDSIGQNLAYVYFEESPSRRSELKRLTRDEAWRIARNIARLPDYIEMGRRVGMLTARGGAGESEASGQDRDE